MKRGKEKLPLDSWSPFSAVYRPETQRLRRHLRAHVFGRFISGLGSATASKKANIISVSLAVTLARF